MTYREDRRIWEDKRKAELNAIAPLIVDQHSDVDIRDAFMLDVAVNWPDGSPLTAIRIGDFVIAHPRGGVVDGN